MQDVGLIYEVGNIEKDRLDYLSCKSTDQAYNNKSEGFVKCIITNNQPMVIANIRMASKDDKTEQVIKYIKDNKWVARRSPDIQSSYGTRYELFDYDHVVSRANCHESIKMSTIPTETWRLYLLTLGDNILLATTIPVCD